MFVDFFEIISHVPLIHSYSFGDIVNVLTFNKIEYSTSAADHVETPGNNSFFL